MYFFVNAFAGFDMIWCVCSIVKSPSMSQLRPGPKSILAAVETKQPQSQHYGEDFTSGYLDLLPNLINISIAALFERLD